jgi:tetratricopeptide (TPR) repeat protein
MKRFLMVLVTVAAVALPGAARAATLDEANAAFAAGKYAESTAAYQSVLDKNGYSAPLLYDLGNSNYREGNYPQAILAYKRALWLAPGDEDIRANLQAAQKQAGSAVEQRPAYAKFTDLLSVNGWAWAGCAAWVLLCASLFLRALLPARRGIFSAAGIVCAFVLADAITAIVLSSGGTREAVVVDKNPAVLIAPFAEAQTQFVPIPGDTVRIEKAHNDYLRVVDGTGRSGWIAKSQVAPVVPEG